MILLNKGWGASWCSETFVWGIPMPHTDFSVPLGRRGGLSSFRVAYALLFFILEIFNLPLPPLTVASIKETEIQAPDLWHINCVSTQLQNVGRYVYHIDIAAVNDPFFTADRLRPKTWNLYTVLARFAVLYKTMHYVLSLSCFWVNIGR